VVFFKLHLVMFFEGRRAARQLMRHAADRPSRVVVHRIRFGWAAARPFQSDPYSWARRAWRCSTASSTQS